MPRPAKAPPPPWTQTAAAAAAAAGTHPERGLTRAEAAARLAAYGRNELAREPPTPLWRLVLAQFDDMLVKVREREGGGEEEGARRKSTARDRGGGGKLPHWQPFAA